MVALLAAGFVVALAMVPGSGPDTGAWVSGCVGAALGGVLGALRERSRRSARWESLQLARLASDEQMDAAERVVRAGVAPGDEQSRALAAGWQPRSSSWSTTR